MVQTILAASDRRVSLPTKLFYGFGAAAFGVKEAGFSYFLLIFYNQVLGLSPQTVGLAIMAALICDAFLDPIIGQVSDNWRSRWGRRHPFMYAAALPVAVTFVLLWNPPAGLGSTGLFAYLVAMTILIRSFITCYEIPSAALAAELTPGYDERTKLLSYRGLFGWIGGLGLYFLGLAVFLQPDATHRVGQLNMAGYGQLGWAAAAIMLVSILVSALGTHDQIPFLRDAPRRKATLGQLAREMAETLTHASFLHVLAAALFSAMARGLTQSIDLYFKTFFWQMSATQIALFTFSNIASAVVAFAVAPRLSARFGKKRSATVLLLVGGLVGCAPVALRLLGLLPPNGDPLIFPLLFVQELISPVAVTTASILFASMIADVVEDSELRTGRRSEGVFFAATAFVAKAVTGIGIFASAALLAAATFPQNAHPGQVAPQVISRLGLIFVLSQGVIFSLAVACLQGYRITRAGHADTLARLAAAADLVAEGEPPSGQSSLR